MIKVTKAAVASSIQDLGRRGWTWKGHCRSGAMDPACLQLTNRCVGNPAGAACIELGPSPFEIQVTKVCVLAFGGAVRSGAPWWEPVEYGPGQSIEVSSPKEGVWSYLAIQGGFDMQESFGSRSTCVREGIGRWVRAGDTFTANVPNPKNAPLPVDPPPMQGEVRTFGASLMMASDWTIGRRTDRMGYHLDADHPVGERPALELSEPLIPGCIQMLPSGHAIVTMAESPTVGGYAPAGIIHSEDLRLVAQSKPGDQVRFVFAGYGQERRLGIDQGPVDKKSPFRHTD
ncbi:MAG: biotin-dependent carboxyltransferase family protein [Actinomycetota bacterium]|nr:biotin-dependent carboxyltransferase family protein [Actinomycetota bacterium]